METIKNTVEHSQVCKGSPLGKVGSVVRRISGKIGSSLEWKIKSILLISIIQSATCRQRNMILSIGVVTMQVDIIHS